MRRSVRYFVVATTVGSLGAGGTLMAYAAWTLPIPAVKVKVVAAKMPSGVTPSAAIQDGRAVVSWTAQELRAGVRMQRYTVTAHSVDVTPRPDVAHTVTATGASTESAVFTSSELGGGKWKWAITPRFETWAGVEGRLSEKVTVPAPVPAAVAPARTDTPAAPVPAATPSTVPAPVAAPASPSPVEPSPVKPPPATATTPAGPPPTVESTTAPDEPSPTIAVLPTTLVPADG